MNLYAVAYYAKRDWKYVVKANGIMAEDMEQALGFAHLEALKEFPTKDGYYEHQIAITPLDLKLIFQSLVLKD